MRTYFKKIVIIRSRKPTRDLNDEIRWIGESLGLFGPRDKDSSCFRIFVELLKGAKKKVGLSSDELAFLTQLTRGTVVHHINKLMSSGIVVSEGNKYRLSADSLEEIIEITKKNFEDACERVKKVAREVDNKLKLS